MKRFISSISIFMSLTCPGFGQVANNLIYGPEWTFTTEALVHPKPVQYYRTYLELERQYLGQYHKDLKEQAISASVLPITVAEFRVSYADGFNVSVGVDQLVLELKATPQTLEQWRSRQSQIQKDIFDTMKASDLSPHPVEGMGHLSIGLKYFQDKPLLYRNFIVDFFNTPGISVVLGHQPSDQRDAIHVSERPEDYKEYLRKELQETDRQFSQEKKDIDFKSYARVFHDNSVAMQFKFSALRSHIAIEFFDKNTPLGSRDRLEIRTLRPQASAEDFVKVVEIFEARIKFLEQKKDFIPYNKAPAIRDGYEALRQYYYYLTEAGLDYERYKSLMPPPWRDIPLTDFLSPEEIKKAKGRAVKPKVNMCSKAFL